MRAVIVLFLCLCTALARGQQFNRDGGKSYDAATELYGNGSYAEAAELYRRSYEFALTPAAHAVSAHGLGVALFRLGRAEQAEAWLQKAWELWPSVQGTADEAARTALWLVEAERTLGHFAAVEPILRGALSARPSVELEAELHNRLAVILKETDKPEDARREWNLVSAMAQATVAQRIDALIGVGDLDMRRMHLSESVESLEKALSLAYDLADRRAQSDALQGLGMAWTRTGDLARAEPLLRRAVALAATPQQAGTALQCLASLSARHEKYALAEEQLLEALASLRKTLQETHPQIAAAKGDLADVYLLQSNLPEANRYADEALSAMRAAMGPDSMSVAETMGVKARIEAAANDFSAAAETYAAAIEAMRRRGASRDFRLARLMEGYASVLASLHRTNDATRVRTELQSLLPGKL
jgi:tetratricopeptide (TPR) repeat protein